jgi:hypothetical protein
MPTPEFQIVNDASEEHITLYSVSSEYRLPKLERLTVMCDFMKRVQMERSGWKRDPLAAWREHRRWYAKELAKSACIVKHCDAAIAKLVRGRRGRHGHGPDCRPLGRAVAAKPAVANTLSQRNTECEPRRKSVNPQLTIGWPSAPTALPP